MFPTESRQTVDCLLSGDPRMLYQPPAAPSLSVYCSSSLPLLPVWWEGQGVLRREEPAYPVPSVRACMGGSGLTGLLLTLWLVVTLAAINTAST